MTSLHGKVSRPQTDEANLAGRVRAARERLGWARETLAHHAGLSWAAISQIEAGRRTAVRAGTLDALAQALGVTTDHLLGREPEKELLAHGALMYESAEDLLGVIVPFLRAAVGRREGVLVVTTTRNIDLLGGELDEQARSIRFERSSEWYRSPVESVNGYRDFTVEQLAAGIPWVNIVGEPIWNAGKDNTRRWVTYEAAFNLVFSAWPVTTICLYDTGALDPSIVKSARRTHPALMSNGKLETNSLYQDPVDYLFPARS